MTPLPKRASRPLSSLSRKIALSFLLPIVALAPLPAAPLLTTDRASYGPSDPINVTFTGGPGNAKDWIGIYAQGVTPSGNPQSLAWFYVNGSRTAGTGRAAGTLTFPAGLGAGNYSAWFLANDGYSVLAGPAQFRVASEGSAWRVNAMRLRHAVAGTAYTGKIRAFASGPDTRSFQKVGGPAWLQMAANGDISGTPGVTDEGMNTFVIRLENPKSGPAEIPLTIEVCKEGEENVSEITVMSFNSWHEWNGVYGGFEKAVDAIVRSDADLIGLQESSPTRAQSMADELGWFRASSGTGSTQVISRYPIVSTQTVPGIDSGRVVGATIRLAANPLREVVMFNTHLDYLNYGPYAAFVSGATPASVLAENNRSERVAQITAVLAGMTGAIANADARPVFLTGDFNVPSHLDWTAATAAHHGGVGPVAWPESTRVQQAGLVDSFRQLHPNPVLKPGDSWSTIHKGTEPQDRIDFVYHRGKALTPVESDLFATEVQTTVGSWSTVPDPTAAVGGNTWPSDHYAMKTTYRLEPVDADGNSLGDAWERRWFQQLGNDPSADPNKDGLTNRQAMLLAVSPTGYEPPIRSLDSASSSRFEVSVSDEARAYSYRIERSTDLVNWAPYWSFDDDAYFSNPVIVGVSTIRAGERLLQIQDAGNANENSVFYRARMSAGKEN